jgi:Zn-dependent peptidase ImmA (M78 family)
MPLDLNELGRKLLRYREQLKLGISELSTRTGIAAGRLIALENAQATPTGDEVLILADFYHCDYRFFISNEQLAAFEQTENLYRRFGDEFSKEDRWRVQEFLFLCECEEQLQRSLNRPRKEFRYQPKGTYFKGHAEDAAAALRRHFGYGNDSVPADLYRDVRSLGIHVFRRRLDNSNISGLTVRHPHAGSCVLVNYSEDVYRQNFTTAHETAHALIDMRDDDVVVSFNQWNPRDLVEIRANTFASRYLLPPAVLRKLNVPRWDTAAAILWALKLKVSVSALAIGLKESAIIDDVTYDALRAVRAPQQMKTDPELAGLSGRSLERKERLLQQGLSASYVSLCFDAIAESVITNARAAEMLLVGEAELSDLAELFGVKMTVHD